MVAIAEWYEEQNGSRNKMVAGVEWYQEQNGRRNSGIRGRIVARAGW